jgi:hypothetical protein
MQLCPGVFFGREMPLVGLTSIALRGIA